MSACPSCKYVRLHGSVGVGTPIVSVPTEHSIMKPLTSFRCRAQLPVVAAIGLASAVAFVGPAFAGADTTFDTALSQFTGFLEGSGGKIITVLSLAGGIVGLASGRFSLGQVAIPVGVGVGAGTGIPIVTSTVTATI